MVKCEGKKKWKTENWWKKWRPVWEKNEKSKCRVPEECVDWWWVWLKGVIALEECECLLRNSGVKKRLTGTVSARKDGEVCAKATSDCDEWKLNVELDGGSGFLWYGSCGSPNVKVTTRVVKMREIDFLDCNFIGESMIVNYLCSNTFTYIW